MPTESTYPSFEVPNQDIWGLLFERKDRQFPDDKGMIIGDLREHVLTIFHQSSTAMPILIDPTPTLKLKLKQLNSVKV